MLRVGAVCQPLSEQGEILQTAALAPQGGQPPQHPGEGLHAGGALPVVGGEIPQMEARVSLGKPVLYRLQQLEEGPLHIGPGAEGGCCMGNSMT